MVTKKELDEINYHITTVIGWGEGGSVIKEDKEGDWVPDTVQAKRLIRTIPVFSGSSLRDITLMILCGFQPAKLVENNLKIKHG